MSAPNLVELFYSLDTPRRQSRYGDNLLTAIPIQDFETHRIGKNSQGQPLVLFSVDDVEKISSAPIVLEHLSVKHRADCRIIKSDETVEISKFSVVHCVSDDRVLQKYFLDILGTMVMALGKTPTMSDVVQAVSTLIELFRAISRPPKKTVQGLWAELFIIERSSNITELIAAWHVRPDDVYDFSFGNQRIEIKSSSQRVRRHHFSLEQLLPVDGIEVLVASIFVERTGTGKSINDLISSIRLKIIDRYDLHLHLNGIVGLTLGNIWKEAVNDLFDDMLAESSLLLFNSKEVPIVNPELPTGVSHVHFLSDLSKSKALRKDQYRNMGGIFAYL